MEVDNHAIKVSILYFMECFILWSCASISVRTGLKSMRTSMTPHKFLTSLWNKSLARRILNASHKLVSLLGWNSTRFLRGSITQSKQWDGIDCHLGKEKPLQFPNGYFFAASYDWRFISSELISWSMASETRAWSCQQKPCVISFRTKDWGIKEKKGLFNTNQSSIRREN